jgi:hypothetical protein
MSPTGQVCVVYTVTRVGVGGVSGSDDSVSRRRSPATNSSGSPPRSGWWVRMNSRRFALPLSSTTVIVPGAPGVDDRGQETVHGTLPMPVPAATSTDAFWGMSADVQIESDREVGLVQCLPRVGQRFALDPPA